MRSFPHTASQDRRRREARARFSRNLLAVLLAALLNIALFGLLYLQSEKTLPALPTQRSMSLKLVPKKKPPKVIEDPKAKGQIVELQEPRKEEIPKDSRYLSQFNTKVDKETKARPQPRATPKKASRPAKRRAEKPQEKKTKPAKPKERAAERSVLFKKPGPRPLTATHSVEALAENSAQLAATDVFVSDDALLDVHTLGDRTNLNSRRFRYWDFFHRVRNQVKNQWRPNEVYQRRDPTWNVYQRQNRLTVVRVVLDDEGYVISIRQARKSGLPFLDEEAIRAFSAAGPFANPPRGLADETGRIAFNFGFYLELNGGVGGMW